MTFEQYRLGDTPNVKRNKHNEAIALSHLKDDLNRTRTERKSLSTNIEYKIRRKNNEKIRMITELGRAIVIPLEDDFSASFLSLKHFPPLASVEFCEMELCLVQKKGKRRDFYKSLHDSVGP